MVSIDHGDRSLLYPRYVDDRLWQESHRSRSRAPSGLGLPGTLDAPSLAKHLPFQVGLYAGALLVGLCEASLRLCDYRTVRGTGPLVFVARIRHARHIGRV